MKKTISITIFADLLAEIDSQVGASGSRSTFIEKVLKDHFRKLERQVINQRDFELINANADSLNREAEDVLKYQADIFGVLEDWANTQ
jgi:metal-responsive CopG/Arc/MetJ family transcriptional regulator